MEDQQDYRTLSLFPEDRAVPPDAVMRSKPAAVIEAHFRLRPALILPLFASPEKEAPSARLGNRTEDP